MAFENGSSTSRAANGRYDELSATHLHVDRSAVRSLEANQAMLEKAAVQRLRASQAELNQSSAMFVSFDQGTLRQSNAAVVVGKSVACDEVRTAVLVSPVVRGEVHTWLDMRSAVAIGVGMVLGKALLAGARALVRRAGS